MKAGDLSGRDIIDANGDKVGEVDDIEVDMVSYMIIDIIAKEGSLSSKLGMGEKRTIPINMISVIGDKVILK